MEIHVTVLGWLFVTAHLVFLLIGGIGLLFLAGIGVLSGDPTAVRVLTFLGTIGAVFFTLLALPGLIAGYGLLKRKEWGRVLAIVVGVLGLVNFPVGTAIGVYSIFVLLQQEAAATFV